MASYPKEAERLLSVPPEEFVEERRQLARKLRGDRRTEEADAVAALRKPPPVVLAANRAARSRPQATKDVERAARQLRSKPGSGTEAQDALKDGLALLEEVALAYLAKGPKSPSEATRRRLHELLQNAAADDGSLRALTRGVLTEEPEPAGFGAYSGARLSAPSDQKGSGARTFRRSRARATADEAKERRARERELRARLTAAERRLRAAVEAEKDAADERAEAEQAVDSLRRELDRLG